MRLTISLGRCRVHAHWKSIAVGDLSESPQSGLPEETSWRHQLFWAVKTCAPTEMENPTSKCRDRDIVNMKLRWFTEEILKNIQADLMISAEQSEILDDEKVVSCRSWKKVKEVMFE